MRSRITLAVVVVALVGAVAVASPQEAEADELVDSITSGCKSIPATVAGTATGALAFITPIAPGSGGAALTAGGAAAGGAGTAAAGGAVAASGGVALSAATVAAVGAVAAGAFCSTFLLKDWLFGEQSLTLPPDFDTGLDHGQPTTCANFGLDFPGYLCSAVEIGTYPRSAAPAVPSTYDRFALQPWTDLTNPDQLCSASSSTDCMDDTLDDRWFPVPAGINFTSILGPPQQVLTAGQNNGRVQAIFRWLCDESRLATDACLSRGARVIPLYRNSAVTGAGMYRNPPVILNADLFLYGYHRVLRSTITCWTSTSSNTYVTRTATSDTYRDVESPPDFTAPSCNDGEVPRSSELKRTLPHTTAGDTLLDWKHPAYYSGITSLPAPTRQCWVVGVTTCPIYDNGDGTSSVGGAGGTVVAGSPASVQTTTDLLAAGLLTAPREDPNASTTTTAAPTTTAATSTTTTSTTTPATTIVPGPSEPPGRDPIDPNDDEGLGCIPSGWNVFNPFAWVYQPVRCVLIWAFVPDTSLADRWDELREDAEAKPPFSIGVWAFDTIDGFFSGFSDAGACGLFPDWDPTGSGEGALPCTPPGGAAWSLAYTVMQIGIVVATGFYLWHMALRAMSGSPEGSSE